MKYHQNYFPQGFLVTAVGSEGSRIGSWTIPYGDSSSQYLHCQGVQDTVTHTDHSSKRRHIIITEY